MDKKKKKLLVLALSASLAATYLSYDHVYTPTYEVLTHDKAYASYSKGKVYIGNAKFLESLLEYLMMIFLSWMKEMMMILISRYIILAE